MPAHFFDGDSYSELDGMGDGGQSFQAGHYYDGSSYTTVWQSQITIDGFEHNDVPGFYSGTGSGTATAETQAAYEGDYGLEITSFREEWATPGSGLDAYYDRGEWFEVWFNPQSWGGGEQYWLALGGTTDGWDNHYEIRCVDDGGFLIVRREDGSTTEIEPTGPTTVNWSESEWYRISGVIHADEIRARLYDSGGSRLKNHQTDESTGRFSWPGKHGFRASGGGSAYFDELQINPTLEV